MVSPGAIWALGFVLEADDQSLDHEEPWKRAAKGPLRKDCIAEPEILAASGLDEAKPKVVWNAWSIAALALEAGVEK